MKKFGTPIGAAPGSANEKVGFDDVGVPPVPRRDGVFVGLVVGLVVLPLPPLPLPPPVFLPEPPPLWVDGCWLVPGPVGLGGFWWVVVLELEELVLVDVVVVVVVVVDEEEDDELGVWQDSETLTIGSVTGRFSADTGVPGGTFTLKVSVWPPATLTVTTH